MPSLGVSVSLSLRLGLSVMNRHEQSASAQPWRLSTTWRKLTSLLMLSAAVTQIVRDFDFHTYHRQTVSLFLLHLGQIARKARRVLLEAITPVFRMVPPLMRPL